MKHTIDAVTKRKSTGKRTAVFWFLMVLTSSFLVFGCASTPAVAGAKSGAAPNDGSQSSTAAEVEDFFKTLRESTALILENQIKTNEKMSALQLRLETLQKRIDELEKEVARLESKKESK